jgi:hypothetical protein
VRSVIILFAKAPAPGRVKTRLCSSLGPEGAAALHTAFVADMIDLLASIPGPVDVELHTDKDTDAWRFPAISRALQCEGDLGARMYHALRRALAGGRPRAMIVGSDAPTLPPQHIERIFNADADVALGPAEDGGYYAIACRRVHPAMFRGVDWSGARVLDQTLEAAGKCDLSVEVGAPWFDVDTPEDLRRLKRSGRLPAHTAGWFRRFDPGNEVI